MAYKTRVMTVRDKSYKDLREFEGQLLGPAFGLTAITALADLASVVAAPMPLGRGIWCNTAGTANLVFESDASGNPYQVAGVQLVQGYNPMSVIGIVAGGSATGLYQMY